MVDPESVERLRESLRQRQEEQVQGEEVLVARIGGYAYSGSRIEIDALQVAYYAEEERVGDTVELMPGSTTEQLRKNQDLVLSLMGVLPQVKPKNEKTHRNRDVYFLHSDALSRNLGAAIEFGPDEVLVAKKFQSNVLWLCFSDFQNDIPKVPSLPFYVIGERSRTIGKSLVVAPVRLQGLDHGDLFVDRTYLGVSTSDSSTKPKEQVNGLFEEVVDTFVVQPVSAMTELVRGGQKPGKDVKETDVRFRPTDIFEINITGGSLRDVLKQRDYGKTDYTDEEIKRLYNPRTKMIEINQDSAGSIKNGQRIGRIKLGKDGVVKVLSSRPAVLTDKVMESYRIVDRLIDLAITFGKHKELDGFLTKQ